MVTKHKEKERKRERGEEDIKSGGFLTKHAFLLQITQIQSILVPYIPIYSPSRIPIQRERNGVGLVGWF